MAIPNITAFFCEQATIPSSLHLTLTSRHPFLSRATTALISRDNQQGNEPWAKHSATSEGKHWHQTNRNTYLD